MEIDLAIVNLMKKNGIGNIAVPTTITVNASRPVRKKKAPVKKRVIKKVIKPKKKRVNLVTYEEPTEEEDPDEEDEEIIEEIVYEDDNDEEVEYVEVEGDTSTRVTNLVKKK